MSCKSFWTSLQDIQQWCLSYILMSLRQKSGIGNPANPITSAGFYSCFRPPGGGRTAEVLYRGLQTGTEPVNLPIIFWLSKQSEVCKGPKLDLISGAFKADQ
jgi:hypothetical protein